MTQKLRQTAQLLQLSYLFTNNFQDNILCLDDTHSFFIHQTLK